MIGWKMQMTTVARPTMGWYSSLLIGSSLRSITTGTFDVEICFLLCGFATNRTMPRRLKTRVAIMASLWVLNQTAPPIRVDD